MDKLKVASLAQVKRRVSARLGQISEPVVRIFRTRLRVSVDMSLSRRTSSSSSSQDGSDLELRAPPGLEDATADSIRELLDRAISSLQAATNQAARRRVRQRLQRRLSDFLTMEQYEKAMEQFKFLCETRLGYVWRVAQHGDQQYKKSSAGLPGVCYLQFNDMTGQWEHGFV